MFSLKSNESMWLMAPEISRKITFFAWPRGWTPELGLAWSLNGSIEPTEAPNRPNPPYWRSSRREGSRSPTLLIAMAFVPSSKKIPGSKILPSGATQNMRRQKL
jgi:hypothetical protein